MGIGKAYRVSLRAGRKELSQVLAYLEKDALNAQDRHLLTHLLHQMLGPASGSPSPPAAATGEPSASVPSPDPPSSPASEHTCHRGHGPYHATSYTGARQVWVAHPCLHPGDGCPEPGCRGRLFDTRQPSRFLRFTGAPLIRAMRYEQQVLRYSTCEQGYRAPLPGGVAGGEVRSERRCGHGDGQVCGWHSLYRWARLQQAYGVPLPESTQWERCEVVADALLPVFLHLRRLASFAGILIGDDTRVQILSCTQENRQRSEGERHGLHTTGIVPTTEPPHSVILYQSGRRHAGENVGALLQTRPQELGPPLQVGDALAANWSHHLPVIAVKGLAHLRRQFTSIEALFPEECGHAREALAQVYRTEAETWDITPEERLAHHQRHSDNRDVGCYFGLRPKQRQSGERDPQLGIDKAGDRNMRQLLVQCAQHILGCFGADSALRRWGLALAGRGGARAKKRAPVAVARKLAVLLHRLWSKGEVFQAFPDGVPDRH